MAVNRCLSDVDVLTGLGFVSPTNSMTWHYRPGSGCGKIPLNLKITGVKRVAGWDLWRTNVSLWRETNVSQSLKPFASVFEID